MNGMFWTYRQKLPAKFVVFDTYTQYTIFSSPRRGKCRHDNQRRQQVVVVESHRETLGLCVFLPIYVASIYRYLRRLSPCNFRANCTETRISLIVGQINETIFQIVIQAPNLACILLLGRVFIKER